MTAYQLLTSILSHVGAENVLHDLLRNERGWLEMTEVYVTNPEGLIEGAVVPLERVPTLTTIYPWPDHGDNMETYTTEWPSNFDDCPRDSFQGMVIR